MQIKSWLHAGPLREHSLAWAWVRGKLSRARGSCSNNHPEWLPARMGLVAKEKREGLALGPAPFHSLEACF